MARQPLKLVQLAPHGVRKLPRLELVKRHGSLLRVNPLSDMMAEDVASLNLLSGCPHQCTFCYARAYPNYPGDDVVYLYADAAELLRKEFAERRKLPRAVYLCPSTDPFPPFAAVQAETCRVMDVLAEYGVEAWFLTRGYIRPTALETLARHRELVRVTTALTTVDRQLAGALEPLAAPPQMRLKQFSRLRNLGVAAQVVIEPLIPDLTDTRENLEPLLEALAGIGVERVTTGYLYLRTGIAENLKRELGPHGWADTILDAYATGPVLSMGMGKIAPARHLPRAARQRGYALLMALAASRGITVSVSGMTNPDFKPPRPPSTSRPEPAQRQLLLEYPGQD